MKKQLLSFAVFFLIFQAHGQYTFEKTFGQIIYQETGITRQEIVFYRNNNPAGIYFYILKQNNIIISAGKFLIMQD